MRIFLALVAVALVGVVAACSGGRGQSTPPGSNISQGTVLGIVWHENEGVLRRFDRPSLTPTSERVKLGHNGGAWSFSPDRSKVAVAGGAPLEVRIVDLYRMRLEGVAPLPGNFVPPPGEPAVIVLAWPTARRILALVEWGAWGHAVVVLDPVERRIVSRQTIDGTLVGQAATHDGLALLLAPPARIGPSRLLLVDAAGKQRAIPLAEVRAGLETIDVDSAVSRVDVPALAVDPTGARALVIPAGGPVADIDLATGNVLYREVREAVSILGRLRNWLEPTAEAKAREGPERQATWLGSDFVAVSGQDARRLANGQDQEQTTPAGLALIDVRDWTKRTLDEQASQFSFSAGTLLAYGTSWNSATQKTTGMGLTAYGLDGEERFHLFEDEPIYYVETAGSYAYVWRNGAPPVTVDLRSGSVIRKILRDQESDLPALIVP
ncbi:MAG: hypothetical protein M3312_05750 [Actinomycetota bacterium]|nr:hypothetical protein [Actinomycetota bacterium]